MADIVIHPIGGVDVGIIDAPGSRRLGLVFEDRDNAVQIILDREQFERALEALEHFAASPGWKR